MASIQRTAYPRFKRGPSVQELTEVYTPSAEELVFIREHARGPSPTLTVAVALVTGWLGGELVERLRVGVDEGAHLDAPNSLSGRQASEGARANTPVPPAPARVR